MRIITLATQKGGSGKSTLAANLGVQAERDGYRVALLDTDPQGTLFKWGERRKADTPAVDRCEPHQLDACAVGVGDEDDLDPVGLVRPGPGALDDGSAEVLEAGRGIANGPDAASATPTSVNAPPSIQTAAEQAEIA